MCIVLDCFEQLIIGVTFPAAFLYVLLGMSTPFDIFHPTMQILTTSAFSVREDVFFWAGRGHDCFVSSGALRVVLLELFNRVPGFDLRSEGCRPELWNAACHAGDNMFAFGTDAICANASFTPFEKELSNAYVCFAKCSIVLLVCYFLQTICACFSACCMRLHPASRGLVVFLASSGM